ncbi:hypothetical protein IVB30_10795 [Bradyrhizobium sp. 200]|uniref:hypothetical protein n=1 Tax=Bradyrhizobium sp. 200 TaxID=2782665 RepID=UPI001FFECFB7|nr:hypothetical protein [Bradyrhizobium sp. 200]UPJ51783.1 hypothetical protein IVB30_10795 [Bradyrhizobium sp. 200]
MPKLTSLPPGVRLDAAIERTLAAPNLDGVTRKYLDEAQTIISQTDRPGSVSGFAGRNLVDALMTFVMPRLRNPHVLQAERHRALLEQLQADLAGSADDRIVREGVLTIRRELKRLSQLRQNSNSLVEG